MAMVWLILLGSTVIVTAGGWVFWRRHRSKVDTSAYPVMVALHLIRRQLDVFHFKVEVRREALIARRLLGKELGELERREPQP
jgi:LPXTG-motif cell wall-anchored protein